MNQFKMTIVLKWRNFVKSGHTAVLDVIIPEFAIRLRRVDIGG